MGYLRFSLVVFNGILFLTIAWMSLRYRASEASTRTRQLWALIALVAAALVLGSVQRALVQASLLGWLPDSVADAASTDWQVAQSLVVASLAVLAFLGIRRIADSFAASERVAGSILDRVSHVEVAELGLSPREEEILALIGAGRLSDAELCEVLHISASTVQTHVKSLLKKTGLSSRQDLIAVAHLRSTKG